VETNLKTNLMLRLFPFLQWWGEVNRSTLRADLLAGLTGAMIVLPQGVAFATIAGLPPVYGLYTAMITPVVAAMWGSSRHLVSGPTTAISLVIFATVGQLAEPGSPAFIQAALTITFLAGVFQLAMGLARMGTLVNFVSHVVVSGFTAGAAILILLSQLKHLLGLNIRSGSSMVATLRNIAAHSGETNPWALGLGLATLGVALLSKRLFPKIPHLLVGLVFSSVAAYLMGGESVGLRVVGKVSGVLPPFSVPELDASTFATLAQSAFAVALLGLIEAVAIARSIASKSQQEIDGNQEFIGQGLSNLVGSFWSCYAGSGSFTRSGINYAAGARTPLAAVFAAILLALVLLLVAPLIAYLPNAGMAGVIILVAYNLIDFHFIRTVARASKRQATVLLITLLATLFVELEYAVFVGVMFSLIFYLQRTSSPNVAVLAPDPDNSQRRFIYTERKPLAECPQVRILRIDGSIFFGSINHISSEIRRLTDVEEGDGVCRHLLIIAKGINFIDVAGAEWCVQEARRWEEKGGGMYFSGLKLIAQDTLIRGGFKASIGEDHFFATKQEAVTAIIRRMDMDVCRTCQARIFLECSELPGG
jgi:SulP family sulfate permease